MKKIFLFVLAIAAVFVSCSNEDLAGTSALTSETSVSIASYVADNYPATSIVSTTVSGSLVKALLNTGEELSFTTSGTLISYSNNYKQGLPADSIGVSDSISTDSIDKHDHHGHDGGGRHGGDGQHGDMGSGHGHHGLTGDSTFVEGNHKHGRDRHFDNEVAVDSLSSGINTYISANYLGYTVIHAQIDTICQGVVTEVLVCLKTSEPIKLVFDVSGIYLFKTERMHYADVPTVISDAVTANYSTYTSKKRAEKITLADGSIQYEVFMSLDKTHKVITFNADGTVACEK